MILSRKLGGTGFWSKQLGQTVSSGCIGFLQVLHLAISSNPELSSLLFSSTYYRIWTKMSRAEISNERCCDIYYVHGRLAAFMLHLGWHHTFCRDDLGHRSLRNKILDNSLLPFWISQKGYRQGAMPKLPPVSQLERPAFRIRLALQFPVTNSQIARPTILTVSSTGPQPPPFNIVQGSCQTKRAWDGAGCFVASPYDKTLPIQVL